MQLLSSTNAHLEASYPFRILMLAAILLLLLRCHLFTTLEGETLKGGSVLSYRGIPYAMAPLEHMRFKVGFPNCAARSLALLGLF